MHRRSKSYASTMYSKYQTLAYIYKLFRPQALNSGWLVIYDRISNETCVYHSCSFHILYSEFSSVVPLAFSAASFRLSELPQAARKRIPPRRYCARYTAGRFFAGSKWGIHESHYKKGTNGYTPLLRFNSRKIPLSLANIFPRRASWSVGKQETRLPARTPLCSAF